MKSYLLEKNVQAVRIGNPPKSYSFPSELERSRYKKEMVKITTAESQAYGLAAPEKEPEAE